MDFGWKRSFRLELEERKVFGLDIGSSSVNAVQLEKKSDDWVVTAASRVRIAPNQEDGRETNTVSAIGKCFESMGIRTQMAVCGVSGPEVAVRDFMFHSLARDEVEPAVMLEAAQVCPFNADDVTVDYQSICRDKDSIRGILVAATKRLINRRKDLAKQAAVNCVLMDVDGLALLNCLSECEKAVAQQTAAILNIGHSYTTLAIMGSQGGLALPFIRDVAYSGNDITKAIAIANDISKEAVEEVLLEGKSNTEKPIVFENALDQACERLIVDVTQTLRYYTAQENSNFVEKIFVCGAFAAVPGLVELLRTQLPTKIELWNPLEKLGCEAGQKCKSILLKDGHAMAVAAGLAMRSI